MNLGKAIKLCRVQCGISQVELANRSNLTVSYISLLENNKRDPAFSTIQKIARSLRITMSGLMEIAEKANPLYEEKSNDIN